MSPTFIAMVFSFAGGDSDAVESAIARSAAGDTVSLPAGTFAIDRPVRPRSKTHLRGAGQERTVLRFAGKGPGVLMDLSGCEDVEISDLALDGANDPNATQGISASDARRLKVHRVSIRNLVKGAGFGPHAILFSGRNPNREGGVTDSEISDCRIEDIGVGASFGCGVRLSWGSSRNRVVRCTIDRTGRGGIFGDNGSTDLVIQGNTVSNSGGEGLGIEVWGGCDRAVIEDNRIDHWLSFGGCDRGAARRNVIGDASGEHKFCGIEAIGSYLVITDNLVDGGQKIGLSVSGNVKKDHVFWGRNVVRACNQWGAQLQGESAGLACHYFYRSSFTGMPVGAGDVWYPGDEGHGFRVNGNARHVTFEECEFSANGRFGLQLIGANVDALEFVRCAMKGNKGAAVIGPSSYSALEWTECAVTGNARDILPPAKPFPQPPPAAAFDAPVAVRAGEPARFASTSRAADGGSIAAVLWDFGDGFPSTDAQAEHVYTKPGTYRVTLLVWDAAGRAGRAEREVKVAPPPPPWKTNQPIVTVRKELCKKHPAPPAAAMVSVWYVGPKLERLEIHALERRDDVPDEPKFRLSKDNGRTWSDFAPLPPTLSYPKGVEVWEGSGAKFFDPESGVLVDLWLRQIARDGTHHNFTYSRISRDLGATWSAPRQLGYEGGEPFDPDDPLKPGFLKRNLAYFGNNVIRHSNGTLILAVAASNIPPDAPDPNPRRIATWDIAADARSIGSRCFVGRWNAAQGDYEWTAGAPAWLPRHVSSRGLMEPEVAELRDGRVLVVWRGSNAGLDIAAAPGRKWFSLSSDGGLTLSPVAEWKYDDGESFYSPSSIHRMIRHGTTKKLYWIGNISEEPPNGNSPRYPLVIAEVDESIPALRKATVTAIDDRQPGQGPELQLSNFSLFENRETGEIELYLTAYGESATHIYDADAYKYTLRLSA